MRYACQEHRDGEIDVVIFEDYAQARDALASGKAIQGYWEFVNLKKDWQSRFPNVQVWYTERNGDPIMCICPQDTPPEALPSWAMDYMAFEWIDPDKEFGTGIMPKCRHRPKITYNST